MRKIALISLFALYLNASMLDYFNLQKAKKLYENKKYDKAEQIYKKYDNDEARLNEANSLYKQKKYKQAIKKYQSIKSQKLSFDKFYNMGNAYAKNNEFQKAINSYQKALSLKEDSDARFNLELIKKLLKKQQK